MAEQLALIAGGVLIVGFAIWLAVRASKSAGGSEADAHHAEDNVDAQEAEAERVRGRVGGLGAHLRKLYARLRRKAEGD